MHLARMNQAPAVAKPVRVVALNVKALLGVVLKNGHGVVAPSIRQGDSPVGPERGPAAHEQGETIAQKYANRLTAVYNLELLFAGMTRATLLDWHSPEPGHTTTARPPCSPACF
jgi:hypothetical protein